MRNKVLQRYRVRFAENAADLQAALALRRLTFGATATHNHLETDGFDDICRHILVENNRDNQLVCCYRVLSFQSGKDIKRSYAAQFYDLQNLAAFSHPMIELGRFCVRPEAKDPDILRYAWAMLAQIVDAAQAKLIFGCASFSGTNPAPYGPSFALLRDRFLAPENWKPAVKKQDIIHYSKELYDEVNVKAGLKSMPSLLKSYLAMGGWVSDHAVVDHDLNTLHVFTGLLLADIPAARLRNLRSVVLPD